jgi:hypothetical protein
VLLNRDRDAPRTPPPRRRSGRPKELPVNPHKEVPVKRIALAVCLLCLAAAPASATPLYIDVGTGTKVEVEVAAPASNVQTDDGREVVQWSPADAARIAAALANAHAEWAIPQTLGVLHVPDQTLRCLHVLFEQYGFVDLVVPGRLSTDRATRIVWSAEQIEAVQAKLHDIGRPDLIGSLFAQRLGSSASPQDTVLTPSCGQCLNGHTCTVNGQSDCCGGTGTACTSCRVCAPKHSGGISVDPVLP